MARHLLSPSRAALVAILMISLGACESLDRRQGLERFQAHTFERARQAEEHGDLAHALDAYLVLAALRPNDAEVSRYIGLLRDRIRQRSALHQVASRKALKAGNTRRARIELMRALALEPDNRDLLSALARIEAGRVHVSLRQRRPPVLDPAYRDPVDIERTLMPPRLVVQKQSSANSRLTALLRQQPGEGAARQRLISELIEFGGQLIGKGKTTDALRCLDRAQHLAGNDQEMLESITAAKKIHASRLYKQAVAARRRDPGQAARLLRQVLRLQPDFAKARLQLGRLAEGRI